MTSTQCNERRDQLCAQLRETLEPVEDGDLHLSVS